jgi:hypothetical protein
MKKAWFLMFFTMAVVLYGCSPSQTVEGDSPVVPPADPKGPVYTVDPSVTPQNPATAATPHQLQPLTPIQGVITPVGSALSSPYPPDLLSLIDLAVEDLSQKLSVPKTEIEVMAAYSVIWPDAGLGCSQSGMASAQVLTPGYLILLDHNGVTYEYHTDKGTYVTSCENPSAPIVLPDQ